MFKYLSTLFSTSKKQDTISRPAARDEAIAESLFHAIEVQRESDPLIGAKLGAEEVLHRLMKALKNEHGVHIESLLCALGAVAGYACQASVRAHALEKGMEEAALLITAKTIDGEQYFYGDPLNKPLAESKYSVWSLALGAAQHNGCKNPLDLSDIFSHVAKSLGSDSFGIPRIPPGHTPGDTPMNYLIVLWPMLLPVAKKFCKQPEELPILFAMAIHNALLMGKDALAPDLALRIIMESAVPMSKVDLSAHQ